MTKQLMAMATALHCTAAVLQLQLQLQCLLLFALLKREREGRVKCIRSILSYFIIIFSETSSMR
eukprot:scaffold1566_cov185-Ochromonas_danica.AAC.4